MPTAGRKPTFDRKYEIQTMWQHHHEIVRLTLLGNKPKDIAEKLGLTTQTISNTLNSKIVRDKLQIMRASRDAATVDVATAIQDLAPAAIEAIGGMIQKEGISDAVKLNACKDVLDRAGHKPVDKTQHVHAHLSGEEIEAIKARAIANGLKSGQVVQLPEETGTTEDAEFV